MTTAFMLKKLSLVTAGAALMVFGTEKATQAATVTLNFNDAELGYVEEHTESGYTFDLSGILVTESPVEDYSGTGLMGGQVGTNVGGFPVSISSDNPFKLYNLSAFSYGLEELDFTVQGFRNGAQQFTSTYAIADDYQRQIDGTDKWIDTLQFSSSGGASGELYQNAFFNNITVEAVPEPSTGLTSSLALGALGLGWLWKRQKQQKQH